MAEPVRLAVVPVMGWAVLIVMFALDGGGGVRLATVIDLVVVVCWLYGSVTVSVTVYVPTAGKVSVVFAPVVGANVAVEGLQDQA